MNLSNEKHNSLRNPGGVCFSAVEYVLTKPNPCKKLTYSCTFAKGFGLTGGEEIYDMETFIQISSPYFGLHVKPRVDAFFESVCSSENAYTATKMLLRRV